MTKDHLYHPQGKDIDKMLIKFFTLVSMQALLIDHSVVKVGRQYILSDLVIQDQYIKTYHVPFLLILFSALMAQICVNSQLVCWSFQSLS